MESVRKSWIERLDDVKNLLKEHFSDDIMRNLHDKMSAIAHYHYNKKKTMILGKDKKIYKLLIENSFNPYTVYRWLLLEKVPEDIRFQLKNNQLSQRKAFKLSHQRKRETKPELSQNIRQMGLRLVRSM